MYIFFRWWVQKQSFQRYLYLISFSFSLVIFLQVKRTPFLRANIKGLQVAPKKYIISIVTFLRKKVDEVCFFLVHEITLINLALFIWNKGLKFSSQFFSYYYMYKYIYCISSMCGKGQ